MNIVKPSNYLLRPGFIFVTDKSTCISTVLGSSVSVCIFDKKLKFGGMNHFRFPFTKDQKRATALYGNVSTISLIRMILKSGSKEKNLEAQIYGGAFNPEISDVDIGSENTNIAKTVLKRFGVEIVSEDIGGLRGRKVVFNTQTNEIIAIKVEKIREMDWYPYTGER